MKIQNKIALLFTVLCGGIIISLNIFIYFFAANSISNSFFHRLEVRSDIVVNAALHENRSKTSIYYDIKERHLGDLPFEQHRLIWQDDPNKLNAVRRQLPVNIEFYNSIRATGNARTIKKDTSYVALTIEKSNQKITVISSAVDVYGIEEMENLKKLLTVGFFISLIFIFTFGKLFSAQIFFPIRRIIKNVNGINADNLHQRLIIDGTKDEVDLLSKTFNNMLDRLEITFEMQNNFVSNASHEFKTPLTIISGEAQIGLSAINLPENFRHSFQVIHDETERLEHLTNSMLNLAQTGFDGKKQQWEKLRIDELIISVQETINKISPNNRVQINFDELPEEDRKLTVSGNEALLKSAFTNIILNSCKYSDNKPVQVNIRTSNTCVMVEVNDEGIGIPDREIGQIFVPFFRASNTMRYKGYGIGLPLTNNIIKMHNGTISVESKENKGTRFLTYLPFAE